MKDFFCDFLNFFPHGCQTNQGVCKNSPNNFHKIRCQVADFQYPAAQLPKIQRPAGKQKDRAVQPDLSAPGPLRPEKQRRGHSHPENKIQRRPQKRHAQPHPQHAEHVVQNAHAHAQTHCLEQRLGLLLHGNGHPRIKRAKNPPRSRPPSS